MGPIVVDIDPVIIGVGHFALRWYAVGIMLGILAAFTIAAREARRRGLDTDEIYNMGLWAVLGGLAGARLLHVIDNWGYYSANPGSIIAIQQGGLAILGGILGGTVVAVVYIARRGLPLGKIADAVAPGMILGQAIGRIGCIVNGDAVGAPTSLPWGLVYTNPGAMAPSLGDAYQPTQVYEMLWDLLVFGLLWWARGKVKLEGGLFLAYLGLYSFGKFVISFWRQEALFLLGLQEAQVVALASIAGAGALAYHLWARQKALPAAVASGPAE
ncbi:MAG TPA: prolipoprotein diacylglyceryl transferase [Chloroflexota bacterium]|nr:prolipoprotein diacylglyceryl transferase [Chloroflexota bacterium]